MVCLFKINKEQTDNSTVHFYFFQKKEKLKLRQAKEYLRLGSFSKMFKFKQGMSYISYL